MECLTVALTQEARESWRIALEDVGEAWRCALARDGAQALALMRAQPVQLLVLGRDPEARGLAERLLRRPVTAGPYIICDGWSHPVCDGTWRPAQAGELAEDVRARERDGLLPRSALLRLPELTCLSRGLLDSLDVSRRLRAWDFLPDMLALCAAHPVLMDDLRHRLYPLVARRHAMTPAAVERSLRLAVESTWSRGDLAKLERFFGHSVDPERGKPTNKEFLARLQERMALAAERIE